MRTGLTIKFTYVQTTKKKKFARTHPYFTYRDAIFSMAWVRTSHDGVGVVVVCLGTFGKPPIFTEMAAVREGRGKGEEGLRRGRTDKLHQLQQAI